MKKVLVIACVAALLLATVSIAFAGTETNWAIKLQTKTVNNTNFVAETTVGTKAGSTDLYDQGIGRDAPLVEPADNQTAVVSYHGDWVAGQMLRTDYLAPIDAASSDAAVNSKNWDLVLWTGTAWGEGAPVVLNVWSTTGDTPLSVIGGIDYLYTLTVISDPTGTFDAGTAWSFAPGAVGTGTAPVFSVTFSNGHLLSSSIPNAPANGARLVLSANPVPEPGSMLALASGLVGMAGFAIRRRRA